MEINNNQTAFKWSEFISECGYINNNVANHIVKYMNLMGFHLKEHLEQSNAAKKNLIKFTTINNALKLTPKMVEDENGNKVQEVIEDKNGRKKKQYLLDRNNKYIIYKKKKVPKGEEPAEPEPVEKTCSKLINAVSDFKAQMIMLTMLYINDCKDIIDMHEVTKFEDLYEELDSNDFAKVIITIANNYKVDSYFKSDIFGLDGAKMSKIISECDKINRALNDVVKNMYEASGAEYNRVMASNIVDRFIKFIRLLVIKIMPFRFYIGNSFTCNRKVINAAIQSMIWETYPPSNELYDYALLAFDNVFKAEYDKYVQMMKKANKSNGVKNTKSKNTKSKNNKSKNTKSKNDKSKNTKSKEELNKEESDKEELNKEESDKEESESDYDESKEEKLDDAPKEFIKNKLGNDLDDTDSDEFINEDVDSDE